MTSSDLTEFPGYRLPEMARARNRYPESSIVPGFGRLPYFDVLATPLAGVNAQPVCLFPRAYRCRRFKGETVDKEHKIWGRVFVRFTYRSRGQSWNLCALGFLGLAEA